MVIATEGTMGLTKAAMGLQQYVVGAYRLQKKILPNGMVYPTIWKNGELIVSGAAVTTDRAAQSFLVVAYYRAVGELPLGDATVDYRLIATSPHNEWLTGDKADGEGNVEQIKESIALNGNQTDLFQIVCTPDGLVSSGNSRLRAIVQINEEAVERGEEPPYPKIDVKVSDRDFRKLLILGNKNRRKSDMMLFAEAEFAAAAEIAANPELNARSRGIIRDHFIRMGGTSGAYGNTLVVKAFISDPNQPQNVKDEIKLIAERDGTKAASGLVDLRDPEKQQELAAKVEAQTGIPTAPYEGLEEDVRAIRVAGNNPGQPHVTAAELMQAPPEARRQAVAKKVAGDSRPIAKIVSELQPKADPDPDRQDENFKLSMANVHPSDCWGTTEETAAKMLKVLGVTEVDCDPFANPGGRETNKIPAKSYISPIDNKEGCFDLQWSRTIATALPYSNEARCTIELLSRIGSEEIDFGIWISSSAVLHNKKIRERMESLPISICHISTDSPFKMDITPYLLENYPGILPEKWNAANRTFIVMCFGNSETIARFTQEFEEWGIITHSDRAQKEAIHHSFIPSWVGGKAAFLGHELTIELVSATEGWRGSVDGEEIGIPAERAGDKKVELIAACLCKLGDR